MAVKRTVHEIRSQGAQEHLRVLRQLGETGDAAFAKVTRASAKTSGALRLVDTAAADVRGKLTAMAGPLRVLGPLGLAVGAGAAAIAAGYAAAARESRVFNAAVSDLRAITGAAGRDLDVLKGRALELARSTTQSAAAVVEAFKLIASKRPELLGNVEVLTKTSEAAITLAEATGLSLPEAVNALAGALNQFNLPATEANRVINALAAGAKLGTAEIPDLTVAIVKAGTAASAAGVPFELFNATLQKLAQFGAPAEQFGTGFRNVLQKLQKGAADTNPAVVGLTEALANLAKQNLSSSELIDRFGLENVDTARQLLATAEAARELAAATSGTNEAHEQAAVRMDNLDGDLKRLAAAWSALKVSIAENEGPLRTVVGLLVDATRAAGDFLTTTPAEALDKARRVEGEAKRTLDANQGAGWVDRMFGAGTPDAVARARAEYKAAGRTRRELERAQRVAEAPTPFGPDPLDPRVRSQGLSEIAGYVRDAEDAIRTSLEKTERVIEEKKARVKELEQGGVIDATEAAQAIAALDRELADARVDAAKKGNDQRAKDAGQLADVLRGYERDAATAGLEGVAELEAARDQALIDAKARLDELGASEEQHAQARLAIEQKFQADKAAVERDAAEKIAEQQQRELERAAEQQARAMAQPFENAMQSIQSTISGALAGAFSGSIDSAADAAGAIKGIFAKLAADLVTMMLFDGLFGGGGSSGIATGGGSYVNGGIFGSLVSGLGSWLGLGQAGTVGGVTPAGGVTGIATPSSGLSSVAQYGGTGLGYAGRLFGGGTGVPTSALGSILPIASLGLGALSLFDKNASPLSRGIGGLGALNGALTLAGALAPAGSIASIAGFGANLVPAASIFAGPSITGSVLTVGGQAVLGIGTNVGGTLASVGAPAAAGASAGAAGAAGGASAVLGIISAAVPYIAAALAAYLAISNSVKFAKQYDPSRGRLPSPDVLTFATAPQLYEFARNRGNAGLQVASILDPVSTGVFNLTIGGLLRELGIDVLGVEPRQDDFLRIYATSIEESLNKAGRTDAFTFGAGPLGPQVGLSGKQREIYDRNQGDPRQWFFRRLFGRALARGIPTAPGIGPLRDIPLWMLRAEGADIYANGIARYEARGKDPEKLIDRLTESLVGFRQAFYIANRIFLQDRTRTLREGVTGDEFRDRIADLVRIFDRQLPPAIDATVVAARVLEEQGYATAEAVQRAARLASRDRAEATGEAILDPGILDRPGRIRRSTRGRGKKHRARRRGVLDADFAALDAIDAQEREIAATVGGPGVQAVQSFGAIQVAFDAINTIRRRDLDQLPQLVDDAKSAIDAWGDAMLGALDRVRELTAAIDEQQISLREETDGLRRATDTGAFYNDFLAANAAKYEKLVDTGASAAAQADAVSRQMDLLRAQANAESRDLEERLAKEQERAQTRIDEIGAFAGLADGLKEQVRGLIGGGETDGFAALERIGGEIRAAERTFRTSTGQDRADAAQQLSQLYDEQVALADAVLGGTSGAAQGIRATAIRRLSALADEAGDAQDEQTAILKRLEKLQEDTRDEQKAIQERLADALDLWGSKMVPLLIAQRDAILESLGEFFPPGTDLEALLADPQAAQTLVANLQLEKLTELSNDVGDIRDAVRGRPESRAKKEADDAAKKAAGTEPVPQAASGALITRDGLVYAHRGEVVLNGRQQAAFGRGVVLSFAPVFHFNAAATREEARTMAHEASSAFEARLRRAFAPGGTLHGAVAGGVR